MPFANKVINCARCNGQGLFLENSGRWSLCSVCGGGGKVEVPKDCLVCPVCRGNGTRGGEEVICERCDGVGRISLATPVLR